MSEAAVNPESEDTPQERPALPEQLGAQAINGALADDSFVIPEETLNFDSYIEVQPENLTNALLAKKWGVSKSLVRIITKKFRDRHQDEQFVFKSNKDSRAKNTKPIIAYTSEQVNLMELEDNRNIQPPEGAKTPKELAEMWGISLGAARERIKRFQEKYPTQELKKYRVDSSDRKVRIITADQAALIEDENQSIPLEGYSTEDIAQELGISESNARKIARNFRATHPDEPLTLVRGSKSSHNIYKYSAEQVEIIKSSYDRSRAVPEGTLSIKEIAVLWGVNITRARNTVSWFIQQNPDVQILTVTNGSRLEKRLTTEQAEQIRKNSIDSASSDYKSIHQAAEIWGVSASETRRRIQAFCDANPDQSIAKFKIPGAYKRVAHLNLEQMRIMENSHNVSDSVPEGSKTIQELTNMWNINKETVIRITREFRSRYPEEQFYVGKVPDIKRRVAFYTPQQIERMTVERQLDSFVLDDWKSAKDLSELWDVSLSTVYAQAHALKKRDPDQVLMKYRTTDDGRLALYLSPYQIKSIQDSLRSVIGEKEVLSSSLINTLIDIQSGESMDAVKFRGFVELWGAERSIDLIYQFHPEYKKIPVPYVRSIIADYLGDFLVIRGDLRLDKLEMGLEFLSDQNLKDGFIEVVKNSCLSNYNQSKKAGSKEPDLSILTSYIDHLREQTLIYTTPDLDDVFDEVQDYFNSLFEIVKPTNIVDKLKEGRAFPDLNQYINIKEIETKQRMLIADEMGVGKSASAILAKENLGVKRALIVVPSNVVEIWQTYLSDIQSEDGETNGYFKQGEAPRVLTVDSLKALKNINAEDYDYIILSHERLTDKYRAALEQLGFDMLIVDEAHKLKNLISGRRADNLVKLAGASNLEGSPQYLALLSGTPVPNKIGDIAMVLKLLYPEKFEHVANKELTAQLLQGDVLDLRSLLVPRMQMKSLAESIDMPRLEEKVHTYQLSPQVQQAYDVLLDEDELTATEKLQVLRKFVLNPRFFTDLESATETKATDVGVSLRTTFETKDKVVMFVNGYIQDVIRGKNTIFADLNLPDDVLIRTIHVNVSKSQRQAIQKQLKQPGKMLLAVSGQTADVGVDFSAADELIFYNEPWTEYDKLQQRGRVYRPGLTKDLISHSYITSGTIEEGIHFYIKSKYEAVEKLLRGIPLSQLERELLTFDEKKGNPNLEYNPDLAKFYLSSVDRMLKFFSHGKQAGEQNFAKFKAKYGKEYAQTYSIMGSRSYQANVSRLTGTVIDRQVRARKQNPSKIRILDIASGPEILKQHIIEPYQKQIYSLDFNEHHFNGKKGRKIVGSYLKLPIADKTMDYANLALSLHYTSFIPTRQDYERLEVIRELNRVLTVGGRAVISLTNNLDLKNTQTFYAAVSKLGFKVVHEYSGDVKSGTAVRTRLITLEKISDCEATLDADISKLGSGLMQGLKFKRTNVKLKDSRKIATSFTIDDKKTIRANINNLDRAVLKEEQTILAGMERLKNRYQTVEQIPQVEIKKRGYARTFNSKNYLLFKYLKNSNGAVIVR